MVEYTIEQWIKECLDLQRAYKDSKTPENKQALVDHYSVLRDVLKANNLYAKDIEELEKLTLKQWDRFLKRRSVWLERIREYKRRVKNFQIKVNHPETIRELEMIETAKETFRNIRLAYDLNTRFKISWVREDSSSIYKYD